MQTQTPKRVNSDARQAPWKLVLLSGSSCEGPPGPHPLHVPEGRAEGGWECARRGTLWEPLLGAPEEPGLPCHTDGGILAPPLLAVMHLSRLGLCVCVGACWQGLSPTAPHSSSPALCYGPGGRALQGSSSGEGPALETLGSRAWGGWVLAFCGKFWSS